MIATLRKTLFTFAALCAALAFAPASWSQQPAGSIQFVSGGVEIQRGNAKLPAMRSMIVNAGDLIRTDAAGNVQLNMVDGAFISLRPGTEMRIAQYDYNPMQPTLGDAALELLVGVMRTFTGEIANRNKNRYKMRTHLATLGIRGSGNVLAHFPATGTVNHTLTGAHSMTSQDGQGVERTLVSLPGQTIQVLPGQAPRFIPTPSFIAQAVSPPPKAAAGGEKEETAAAPPTAAAPAATPTTTTAASTTQQSAQQANTAAIATQVAANRPIDNALIVARFAVPFDPQQPSMGFESIFIQSGGTATVVLNAANQLVEIRNTQTSSFLGGPAPLPLGYSGGSAFAQVIAWTGGTHRDGYRNADGSVLLGRWDGGTINVSFDPATLSAGESARVTLDLGRISIPYGIFRQTASNVVSGFTGSATYTLAGATAPVDALGNTGTFNSATVGVNFGALTATLNAALSINNQSLTLGGSTSFSRGSANFGWNRSGTTGNLTIACTGSNCASQGYDGTVGVVIAGNTGASMGGQYRITPIRSSGIGYSNQISGTFALQSATNPSIAPPMEPSKMAYGALAQTAWSRLALHAGADLAARIPLPAVSSMAAWQGSPSLRMRGSMVQ